ncbi:CHAT domain-containing protein [Dictyobacter alpinus]|nr:CHAT domain-containing tetratricopeptide repeat protein [Dictyobacter alpinus]
MNEEQGRQLLQDHVPFFSSAALDRLVYALKKEADHHWNIDAERSLTLSGYLLLIGDLTKSVYYHALGLMARGDALRRLGRNQESLPFFDAAGDEFLSIKDEVSWARTRFGRINACLGLNRTSEALQDAEAARTIFMRHGKLLRAGQIDANAAIFNYELGHYEQALRLFDRAIETYLLHGQDVDLYLARAQGNKALTLAAQGKFREAEALHEQARATFARYGDQEEISVAREELNIAEISASQGHYSRALLLYNQSRERFQRHAIIFAAYEVAQQMCLCLVRLNRAHEAYDLAGETVEYFRTAPAQSHYLARSLMQQAAAAILLDDVRGSEEMLREASNLLEAGGFNRLAALARLQRAELYFADQQVEASAVEVEYVADIFAEQEDLPRLAQAILLQARIADAHGDILTAQDLCAQSLDVAQGQGLLDLQYRCFDLLGQLAERRDDLVGAASYYDRAIQGIDEVQSRLVLDERTSFLENKGGIYQRAITLALRRREVAQALTYVEKAKSRVLGDYLRHNIDIRLRADDRMSEDILDALVKAREEQAWFSSIVYHTEDEANLSDTAIMRIRSVDPHTARQEMQRRERRIEQLFEQIQLRSAGSLVSRPRSNWSDSSASTLGRQLDTGTLLVEYYLTDQDLYIFQLTRESVTVSSVPGAVPQLERLYSLWRTNLDLSGRAAMTSDQGQAFHSLQGNSLGLLKRLYDLLLAPISAQIQHCRHLTVVPYGMLHYIPFHCLYDGTQFVIERTELSYLPSASLMDICRKRGQSVLSQHVPLYKSLVMGLSDNGRLAYAIQEAQTVAQQLQVPAAFNEAATASLLWNRGPSSPIVHIAAHGLFRLDAPNFSHIQLADRQLSTIEVFNLNLARCSLLVLSACETGRAVVGGVDEVMGLGRGFLYAGAASLLPTLWKVDDASSAELMELFYQVLLQGASKAAALAYAQRIFIARARASDRSYRIHPYFWAAFHLIGDAGPLT